MTVLYCSDRDRSSAVLAIQKANYWGYNIISPTEPDSGSHHRNQVKELRRNVLTVYKRMMSNLTGVEDKELLLAICSS